MASILKIDELQGNTAVGDITITSEGGAATQSLQQGLAKVWVNYKGTSTNEIRDSLNLSSVTDNGSGDYTNTYSNAFSNDDFAVAFSSYYGTTRESVRQSYGQTTTTNRTLHGYSYASPGAADTSEVTTIIAGDLA